MKADGTVIPSSEFTSKTFADVQAVRAIGREGNDTQRAIEAAVADAGSFSYTATCYMNNRLSTPVCPGSITIGAVGPPLCDSGFKVAKDLGEWGVCIGGSNWCAGAPGAECSTLASGVAGATPMFYHFGAGCGINFTNSYVLGREYVCSK